MPYNKYNNKSKKENAEDDILLQGLLHVGMYICMYGSYHDHIMDHIMDHGYV